MNDRALVFVNPSPLPPEHETPEPEQSPCELAQEAVAHFERAASLMDVPDQTIERQKRRAKTATQRGQTPSLPLIRPEPKPA